jgi:hypothetical protein
MEADHGTIVVDVWLSLSVMKIHAIQQDQREGEDHDKGSESSEAARHVPSGSNGCA